MMQIPLSSLSVNVLIKIFLFIEKQKKPQKTVSFLIRRVGHIG
jgi:hypothetical protein